MEKENVKMLKKYNELFGTDIDRPDRSYDVRQLIEEIIYSFEILEEIIDNKEDLEKLKDAIKTLKKYKK